MNKHFVLKMNFILTVKDSYQQKFLKNKIIYKRKKDAIFALKDLLQKKGMEKKHTLITHHFEIPTCT